MEAHLISFNVLLGHERRTGCSSPKAASSKERSFGYEGLAAKAAFLRERVVVHGDRLEGGFRKASSYGEAMSGSFSKGRLSGHGDRLDGLPLKAASSDESCSGYESKSKQSSAKVTSSAKRFPKLSKQQGPGKVKQEQPCQDGQKQEDFPAKAEIASLKLEEMEQNMVGDTESWTNDDSHILASVLDKLEALCLHALALEQWHASWLLPVHRKYQNSAQNLLHYVALRSVDLQEVQSYLPTLGLASIEGIESHVIASLARIIDAARALLMTLASPTQARSEDHVESKVYSKQLDNSSIVGHDAHTRIPHIDMLSAVSARRSRIELSSNTIALFGPRSSGRKTYIMVTLSEEMAGNESGVLGLMKAGMDVARINCSHGSPGVWGSIIKTVKHCSQMLERPCRVLMDLAGPKLRTSAFPVGPCVQKVKPHRDGHGNIVIPARVWLALPDTPVPEGMSADVIVPVEGNVWLGSLQIGDNLKFHDARGKPRQLVVTDKIVGLNGIGCLAECFQTAYLESGTELKLSKKKGRGCKGYVADLPSSEHFIRLRKGNLVVLTKENSFSEANESGVNGSWVFQVQVSHTFGQLFESVKPGERIRFDDGKIEGVIRGVTSSEICVEVTFANEKGTKLGGEKSINLPDSNLCQRGLTIKDMVDLDFVVRHADMIGLSFVNNSQDLQIFQQALAEKGATDIGVVLKIETRSGVRNLPEILLQGMRRENPLGVMIARGDLAAECGWESLAGMQEEILRVCNAAHIPAIWATQVLEGLAKQGLPTRPEITDAVHGGRAACVMLNKGLHCQKAVSVLDNILDHSIQPRWEENRSNQPFGLSGPTD